MPDDASPEEWDAAVAVRAGVSVESVRQVRKDIEAADNELEDWLGDQIMRGPGRSRAGRDTERLGKPCPEALGEYHFCERMGFRILPRDLVPGHVEDQPADTFLFYANLLSRESEIKERLEHLQSLKGRR